MPDFLTIQTYLAENHGVVWLTLSFIFIMIEVSAPGIGGLFSGVAALTLGGLLIGEIITPDNIVQELAYFFGLTIVWAAILWKPLKKIMLPRDSAYSDIIGTSVKVVKGDLAKGKTGSVKWSGAIMRAKIIDSSEAELIKEDEEIWIHDKEGTLFLVDVSPPEKSDEH